MPTHYVCLPTGEGASCYDCRQLETIIVLWNDFIKSIETGHYMRRKMIILNYCLPIENLDTLYRSVKSLDTYGKKNRNDFNSIT